MGNVTCRRCPSSTRIVTKRRCALALSSTGKRRVDTGGLHAGSFKSFATRFILPSIYLGNAFDLGARGKFHSVHMRSCGHPAFSVAFRPIARDCQLKSHIRLGKDMGAFDNIPLRSVPIACAVAHSLCA